MLIVQVTTFRQASPGRAEFARRLVHYVTRFAINDESDKESYIECGRYIKGLFKDGFEDPSKLERIFESARAYSTIEETIREEDEYVVFPGAIGTYLFGDLPYEGDKKINPYIWRDFHNLGDYSPSGYADYLRFHKDTVINLEPEYGAVSVSIGELLSFPVPKI